MASALSHTVYSPIHNMT